MKISRRVLTVAMLAACCAGAHAADSINDSTIVGYMERDSQSRVRIFQPAALGERLKASSGNPGNSQQPGDASVGYRIQVFADNSQRNAKNEALSREREIVARFPDLVCYLSYKAPAWRLRAGDFRTRDEALRVMGELKEAFPSYSREMIVVVDKINNPAAL